MRFLVYIKGKEPYGKVIEAGSASSALDICVKATTPDPTKPGVEYRVRCLSVQKEG